MKKKYANVIDMDARDEGWEYEGESSVYSISIDTDVRKKQSDRMATDTSEVRIVIDLYYSWFY